MRAAFLLVRAKRYGMKTININGKEYTKKAMLDLIYRETEDVSGLFEKFCTIKPEPPTDTLSQQTELLYEQLQERENEIEKQLLTAKMNEPEPPTLRPMSELPELNEDIHVLIEHEGQRFWTKGFICVGRVELRYLHQDCWANRDFISKEGVKALKWLPFRELPNPNEIKL